MEMRNIIVIQLFRYKENRIKICDIIDEKHLITSLRKFNVLRRKTVDEKFSYENGTFYLPISCNVDVSRTKVGTLIFDAEKDLWEYRSPFDQAYRAKNGEVLFNFLEDSNEGTGMERIYIKFLSKT